MRRNCSGEASNRREAAYAAGLSKHDSEKPNFAKHNSTHKKSRFWFLAKAALVLLMALSFAPQLSAQTQTEKTPQSNKSGSNTFKDILNNIFTEINRAREQRNKNSKVNNNGETPTQNNPDQNKGPTTPQTNTNKEPGGTQPNNNRENPGPTTPTNNNPVNTGPGRTPNNSPNNNLPDTNANIRTPIANTNSGSSNIPGINTNTAVPVENTTANTDTNTNLEPAAVTNRETPLRQQSPPQPHPPPSEWPYTLILIIAAVATVGIITFVGIRYAVSGGGDPAPSELAELAESPAAAAAPAPQIDIGLRPDVDPKLEIAGGDVPSLDTGISLKFKLDPGQPYLS